METRRHLAASLSVVDALVLLSATGLLCRVRSTTTAIFSTRTAKRFHCLACIVHASPSSWNLRAERGYAKLGEAMRGLNPECFMFPSRSSSCSTERPARAQLDALAAHPRAQVHVVLSPAGGKDGTESAAFSGPIRHPCAWRKRSTL